MPVLWAYARDLFQTPGFGDTVDFVQIKQHYYIVHADINPTGIVPKGPDLANWLAPHRPGSVWAAGPFGDGTPPGPTIEGERVPAGHGANFPARTSTVTQTPCEFAQQSTLDGSGGQAH